MLGRIRALVLAFIALSVGLAGQEPLKFMGRDVTVTHPGSEDKDGMFPSGPSTLCLEGTPRQCFSMPEKIGNHPQAELVEIKPGLPAIFFSAETGGTSGWGIHFALLRPGGRGELENLFFTDAWVSNQSEHAFWTEPEISDAKIFVTADFEWGPDEAHYDSHRYMVSSYLFLPDSFLHVKFYYLQDRYLTAKKYEYDAGAVLATEKPEILARLKRVMQQGASVR